MFRGISVSLTPAALQVSSFYKVCISELLESLCGISRAFAESSSGFGCVHSAVGVLHGLFGCLYMALNSSVALKVKIRGTIRLLAYGFGLLMSRL